MSYNTILFGNILKNNHIDLWEKTDADLVASAKCPLGRATESFPQPDRSIRGFCGLSAEPSEVGQSPENNSYRCLSGTGGPGGSAPRRGYLSNVMLDSSEYLW